MWNQKGDMELACMYLCDCGNMESLMMDYTHLYFEDEKRQRRMP
jgi:hypothetical protein